MKRGLPRPLFKVESLQSYFSAHTEKWDNRRYPMPYTSRDESISLIDEFRAGECVRERRCFVCGEEVTLDKPWALVHNGSIKHGEAGPYHEVCIKIAMKMCPHIAEGVYKMEQVGWKELEEFTAGFWPGPVDTVS